MIRLLLLSLLALAPVPTNAPRVSYQHRPATTTTATTAVPQRIVSLSPMVTETLFALGVGGAVVGVTRYCDKPAAASSLPKIGGYTDVSLEAVLALRPDLVIAQNGQGQWPVLDRLRDRGIAVLIIFNDTVEESLLAINALGVVVDEPSAAQPIIDRQRAALAAAHGSAGAIRVAVVVGVQPLVVAGTNSFADTAVRATGATSAVADSDPAWPVWSLETLLARRVDVIVVADGVASVPALQKMVAGLGARAPQIIASDHAILMRPGPTFADDVDTLAVLLAKASPK